jgi:RimJ/RimL family protein N-acetyltransferase
MIPKKPALGLGPSADLAFSLRLPSGQAVTVRPMESRDTESLQEYVRGLSRRSRHNRFLGALNELSAAELNRLSRLDLKDQAALIAEVQINGIRTIIAEARYAMLPDASQCEIALSVTDGWQRQGLGTLLLDALERRASELGARAVVADALGSNQAVKGLFRKAGFAIRPDIGDARLVRMTKDVRPRVISGDTWLSASTGLRSWQQHLLGARLRAQGGH